MASNFQYLEVVDSIKDCWLPEMPVRGARGVKHLIIHRIEQEVGRSAREVARWFQENPDKSGIGCAYMPYHFIIREDGMVEQALPLDCKAPHAAGLNTVSIGIALIGDFRTKPPTDAQRWSLLMLCRRLCDLYRGLVDREPTVLGHTESGATITPGKECPGKLLSMHSLREQLSDTKSLRLK